MSPGYRRLVLGPRTPLERDVYQVIKNLEASPNGPKEFRRTVPAIYEAIKRSNSSLARQKKRPLEDAIDRVLQVLEREQQESEDSEAAIDRPQAATITNAGVKSKPSTSTMDQPPKQSSTAPPPPFKKRRLQDHGSDLTRAAEAVVDSPAAARPPTAATSERDKTKTTTRPKGNRCTIEYPTDSYVFGGYSSLRLDITRHIRSFMMSGIPKGSNHYRSVLLSGPPGVGKETLVRSVAASVKAPVISLNRCFLDAERLEKSLTEAFDMAASLAPSIIFIKNIDKLMPRSSSSGSLELQLRVELNLMAQMRRMCDSNQYDGVVVMATATSLEKVDPATLRSLMSKNHYIGVPDQASRRDMLRVVTQCLPLADDVDLDEIARLTSGYIGSDFVEMKRRVLDDLLCSIPFIPDAEDVSNSSRALANPEKFREDAAVHMSAPLAMERFKGAMQDYMPFLLRDGNFTAVPKVTWDQIGALDEARKKLKTSIIGPINQPQLYQDFGLTRPAGVLLWGPPGCGKTLIAQAVANEAQASFILINGPELLNKYVGESERAVRELFDKARSATPCILFFDEIDSLVPPRQNSTTESGARVVNALLTELDGVKDRAGIYVIGTTNRPGLIDEAILREGRLSLQILIDLPSPEERIDILQAIYRTRHGNASQEVLDGLATVAMDSRCSQFSGADLGGLHTKAAEHAVEQYLARGATGPRQLTEGDWEHALETSRASIKNVDPYRLRAA